MKAVLAAVLASSTLPAHASHHFEVAIARTNTAISQLDNYVFQAASPGRTVIIMNVNSSPRHGATFSPNALYNIHVALDDKFKEGHILVPVSRRSGHGLLVGQPKRASG